MGSGFPGAGQLVVQGLEFLIKIFNLFLQIQAFLHVFFDFVDGGKTHLFGFLFKFQEQAFFFL